MVNKSKKILAEISAGELLDKLTILEIKLYRIDNLEKKMIKDMNEETYKELLELKRQANNG